MIPTLALLASTWLTSASDGGPPAPLRCLPTWYEAKVEMRDGGWGLTLKDGTHIPWDDGRVKTREEKDESPDVKDLFEVPYQTGPIRPVMGEGEIEDPGRARIERLFLATYGDSHRNVKLAKLRFFGWRIPVAERALPAFERVVKRLEDVIRQHPEHRKFVTDIGGTFFWRRIYRSRMLSTHAFGIAIDLNVGKAHYWRWQRPKLPLVWKNSVPQEIVDAFEAEGFIWGGRWLHYDTMHFEYRPEMLDPSCREPAATGSSRAPR